MIKRSFLILAALVAIAAVVWFALRSAGHRPEAGGRAGGGQVASASAPTRQPSRQCPKVGGVLTIARSADVTDWYYNLDNPSISAWPLVNLALVRNNIDATAVEGMAATSWEANADSTVFTFRLRPGLRFSNGAPLTSADVLDSFNRNYADPRSTLKSRIPQATFAAPDPATFVIRLSQSY
ncbi:MAG: hypothetical protein JSS35_14300, partial [Proteobacteria bacterium]|nr:hypothetical protein [Pseudomonadota bacterium]